MKRLRNILIAACVGIYLFGCSGSPKIEGGSVSYKTTETVMSPNGTPSVKTTEISVHQPDNAITDGKLTISPNEDGSLSIKTNTGQSEKPSAIEAIGAGEDGLNAVSIAGAGLMVAAAFVFIFGNKYWGLVMFGFGAAMACLAYLFVQYKLFFLGLFLVIPVFLWYNFLEKNKLKKAHEETVKTVDLVKSKLTPEGYKEVFEGSEKAPALVKSVQSPSTVELFKKIKGKK